MKNIHDILDKIYPEMYPAGMTLAFEDTQGTLSLRPGQRFGMLTVEDYAGSKQWLCNCDCGAPHLATASSLNSGLVTSCGCDHKGNRIDETGNVHDRLTVLSYAGNNSKGSAMWMCECECGNLVTALGTDLRRKRITSCGCSRTADDDDISDQDSRNIPEYHEWRHAVYARDGYTCRACGAGGQIAAHHILSYKLYPDYRFDIRNGITLCKQCHITYHSIYGAMPTTHETTVEFVRIVTEGRRQV